MTVPYYSTRCAHHVTQRGNNRQDVFFVDADRRAYLGYLQDAAGRFALRVEGYCLMTNHVHLVVTPQELPMASGLSCVLGLPSGSIAHPV